MNLLAVVFSEIQDKVNIACEFLFIVVFFFFWSKLQSNFES